MRKYIQAALSRQAFFNNLANLLLDEVQAGRAPSIRLGEARELCRAGTGNQGNTR